MCGRNNHFACLLDRQTMHARWVRHDIRRRRALRSMANLSIITTPLTYACTRCQCMHTHSIDFGAHHNVGYRKLRISWIDVVDRNKCLTSMVITLLRHY